MLEIEINGEFLDMTKQAFRLTYQRNKLNEVRQRQIGYSSDITVPVTPTNKRLLGFADLFQTGSGLPYREMEGKVYFNGVSIQQRSKIRIVDAGSQGYKLRMYPPQISFWEKIGGLIVRDLFKDIYYSLPCYYAYPAYDRNRI